MRKLLFQFALIISTFTATAQKESSFRFQKIIFNTSGCAGMCIKPIYTLQVDSNKEAKLFARLVFTHHMNTYHRYDLDTNKMGYFVGVINDTVYNNLITVIKTANIDSLNFDSVNCCDGNITSIDIYYNGEEKVMYSMNPPYAAYDLINSLLAICEKNNLKRTTEKFTISNIQ